MAEAKRIAFTLVSVLAVAAALVAAPGVAAADTQPADEGTPQTVSADPLPTPQIDGVAWTQAVVGDKVFVGGHFLTARPDGAAAGENTTPRTHILAYDINTGELDESFAPVLDGQVMDLQASPDGQTLYAGGSFKMVDGQWRVGLAAFDVNSGDLKPNFRPVASSTVRAIAVSDDAVYFGGDFTLAADAPGRPTVSRKHLAAADAENGTLLPDWDPQADDYIRAMTMNPDRSLVVIGGHYKNISGESWYGFSALDPTTAEPQPWAAEATIRNAGSKASLTSLVADDHGILATGYHFGSGGNFEGITRMDGNTGELAWLADCFGDHHYAFEQAGAVYGVNHVHNCANIDDSFDDFVPRKNRGTDVFTDFAVGTLYKDQQRGTKFEGMPAPAPVHWWPKWYFGTYTVSDQAAWHVTGNEEYLVFGGEFIGLNGKLQQGLTRFARPDNAPNLSKPIKEEGLTPSVVSYEAGEVTVGWQENYDRDNERLTYRVYRNYQTINDTPAYEVEGDSNWYDRGSQSFTDTGLTPGDTHSYLVIAFDPDGNRTAGNPVEVTVTAESGQQSYGRTVLQDKPANYYRSLAGSKLEDLAGGNDMTALNQVSAGSEGPTSDVDASAVALAAGSNGTAAQRVQSGLAPDTFTIESWVKTTDADGGRILGYGQRYSGTSSRADRQLYIDNTGAIRFGGNQLDRKTIKSDAGYNDGQWHHVAASMSDAGSKLFVDGQLVAQDGSMTEGRRYAGSWRIGRDKLNDFPSVNSDGQLNGELAEVAIYERPLTAVEIANHAEAGGLAVDRPARPDDEFGAAVYDQNPDLYWRLIEAAGTPTVQDSGYANNDGVVGSGVTLGVEGALHPDRGTAARFDAGSTGIIGQLPFTSPGVYSAGAWVKTTSTAGGKVIGLGNAPTGNSTSFDRHIYLRPDGTPAFGAHDGAQQIVAGPDPVNDGEWHFLVATQSADGMRLFVDGEPVAANAVSGAADYTGYWRIGAGSVWEGASTSFDGTIDEAFVVPTALSPSQISDIRSLGTEPAPNESPTAEFGFDTSDLDVDVDASASTDSDGSIVSYEWTFGDGATATGVNAAHTYAAAGTYPVTLTVTDDLGAVGSSSQDVTVEAPNVLPTASFTNSVDDLKVTLDAGDSEDSDGSIASYAWDFGDGNTGTGVTAEHTYAAAGTYEVTLTVTDNRGGEATAASDVTVEAPNVLPTASFTNSVDDLKVTLDAADSEDSDGSIASYAWDFGDGNTGTGVTAEHTYAAAGTYEVTLTVTDNRGGEATAASDVTMVAPPGIVAADSFNRVLAAGSGTAEVGGSWTHCGGGCDSRYSVDAQGGQIEGRAGSGPWSRLNGITALDSHIRAEVQVGQPVTGGGAYASVLARGDEKDGYRFRVKVKANGDVYAQLRKVENGKQTQVGQAKLDGVSHTSGNTYVIVAETTGASPTTLKFNAYEVGSPEPAGWMIEVTDSAPTLQTAGSVGLWTYLSGSAASPIDFTYKSFVVNEVN